MFNNYSFAVSIDPEDIQTQSVIYAFDRTPNHQELETTVSQIFPHVRTIKILEPWKKVSRLVIYSDKPDFEVDDIRNMLNIIDADRVTMILPIGYQSLICFNDICKLCSNGKVASKFTNLHTIIQELSKNFTLTALKNFCSIIERYSNAMPSLEFKNFLSILRNKNVYNFLSEKCGDLTYQIFIDATKIPMYDSNVSNRIPSHKRIIGKPKIDLYTVCDKVIGHEKDFKLIKPIFVNENGKPCYLSVENKIGFFETQNNRCSELTAIHYVLRTNFDADIIGFSHYRRFLDLESKGMAGAIDFKFCDVVQLSDRIESETEIVALMNKYDLIVASPLPLENTQELQYCLSHYSEDYYLMLLTVMQKFPFLTNFLLESMSSRSLYGSNLFIGRSEIVRYIYAIVFDVLSVFELRNVQERTDYQTRDVAFLSERLFDTIVRYIVSEDFNVSIKDRIHLSF